MNKRKHSIAGIVLVLLAIILVIVGTIFFLTKFKLENIEIRSGNYYSEQQIKDFLFTEKTDNYAVLFVYRINKISKPRLPLVEKIDAELIDRNTVTVYVYDKSVTGCISHMGTYFFFDREGTVVDSSDIRPSSIPEITGLSVSDFTLGKKLDVGNPEIFDRILEMLKLLEKNSLTAENIDFGLRNEVKIYIGDDEFLLGNPEHYDLKINNIPSVLKAVNEGSYRFDFRNYTEENPEVDARRIE